MLESLKKTEKKVREEDIVDVLIKLEKKAMAAISITPKSQLQKAAKPIFFATLLSQYRSEYT